MGSIGHDERRQRDQRIAKTDFQFFDRFMERNLGVRSALQVAYPLRIDERDVLALPDEQPQNKVRMEIASLKKAYAATATEIPEQVHLPFSEEGFVGIVEAA